MKSLLDQVPHDLRALPQWVCWRLERGKDRKPTKVPYNARTGELASSTDPATWSTFEEAVDASGRYNGIGFVLSGKDGFVFIDLDHAIQDGIIGPWAQAIIDRLASYTEVSPSGDGIHVVVRAKKVGNRCGRLAREVYPEASEDARIEVYDHAKYLTVTGDHVDGTWCTIGDRQREFDELYREVFGPDGAKPKTASIEAVTQPSALSDDEIIRKFDHAQNGAKFRALWAGDTSGYRDDDSAADMALCDLLAFYTTDAGQIDRLVRRSALMRDKWDSRRGGSTYGRLTIEEAIATTTEHYDPTRGRDPGPTDADAPTMPKGERSDLALIEARSQEDTPIGGTSQSDPGEPLPEDTGAPNLTDMGNAERFKRLHGTDVRYVTDWRRWLIWDSLRWREDRQLQIERLAKDTVRSIYGEAQHAPAKSQAIGQWATRSESNDRLAAMIRLSQSELAVTADRLDTDPYLLCCGNGVLDLRTGQLLEPRRDHFITKWTPTPYEALAECPLWHAFLERVLPEPEVRRYLQKAVGYTLTGDTSEQVLFFLYGPGANGKTVFLETVSALIGDYFTKARSESLMVKRMDQIPNDIAGWAGARLLSVSELSNNQQLNEGLVKDLTGKDSVRARFLHAEEFTFRPGFKLWLYGNHKPKVRGKDEGIWRRIRLVPFSVVIPQRDRDTHLAEKLRSELPGILYWAVEGSLAWLQDGLAEPDAILNAVNEYRREQDSLADFLADNCVFGRTETATKKALWEAYEQWRQSTGEDGYDNRTAFGKEVAEHPGIKSGTAAHNIRVWRGIGLKEATT